MSGMDLSPDVQMGPVTPATPEQGHDALAHLLAQPDARRLSEALGLVGYRGHNWNSHSKRSVPVWREGSAT